MDGCSEVTAIVVFKNMLPSVSPLPFSYKVARNYKKTYSLRPKVRLL